jgi:hypothetical protein
MMKFYDISHNTAFNLGMPEIEEIVEGLSDYGSCPTCGGSRLYPAGDIRVRLGKTRAKMWPDAIACGEYPCFVISEHFARAIRECRIQLELGGKVEFVNPIASGLPIDDAPTYYWIDGKQHFGGRMDFETSGYVDVQFCEECGNRTDNISLTYDRQHTNPPPPIVFDYDYDSGLDLFTTDLSPTAFFCTDRLLNCAKQHKLTNLSFCAVEDGAFAEPVKY